MKSTVRCGGGVRIEYFNLSGVGALRRLGHAHRNMVDFYTLSHFGVKFKIQKKAPPYPPTPSLYETLCITPESTVDILSMHVSLNKVLTCNHCIVRLQ